MSEVMLTREKAIDRLVFLRRKLPSHGTHGEEMYNAFDYLEHYLQSLSQEAVRDEALEDIPNEVCQAGMDAWNETFGSPYTRYAAIYRAMQSALKREPNAAGQAEPRHSVRESDRSDDPAPAAPVAEMVRRLKEMADNYPNDSYGASSARSLRQAAVLLIWLSKQLKLPPQPPTTQGYR